MDYTLWDGRTLTLRRPKPEEAAAVVEYVNRVAGETGNMTFGENEFSMTVEEEAEFLRGMAEKETSVIYIGVVEGQVASFIGLQAKPKKRLAHVASIGISVRKDFWRLGIGNIMMRAVIDFARQTGVLRLLELEVRADNAGAIALYEGLGFEVIGRHQGEFFVDGQYYDTLLMDLRL